MAKSREQYIAENSEYNYTEDLATFSLLDESTVKKLQKDGDIKLPRKKIDVPKDMRWNTKQMSSKLLHGILNGDSIPKIAKSLEDVIGNNQASTTRNARTMVTGAENAGRLDSYDNLAEQGVVQKKVWIATPDSRTRESHIEIDGEEVDIDADFSNGCKYPGDPDGDPSEVWNCRCSMRDHIIGFRRADGTIAKVGAKRNDTMHDEQMAAEKASRGIEVEEKPAEEPAEETKDELHGDIEAYNRLKTRIESNNIPHKAVDDLPKKLSNQEIIDRLAGADKTEGSCVSLALSYCANKAGIDVIDFRGGASQKVFSRGAWRDTIKIANANMTGGVVNRQASGVAKAIKNLETGKEYMLICGRHAAIIKNTDNGLQYLEMQSGMKNGWKPFERTFKYEFLGREVTEKYDVASTLHSRFGCTKTTSGMYTLVDVDSFQNTEEFRDVLGYINTDPLMQKKGAGGGIK